MPLRWPRWLRSDIDYSPLPINLQSAHDERGFNSRAASMWSGALPRFAFFAVLAVLAIVLFFFSTLSGRSRFLPDNPFTDPPENAPPSHDDTDWSQYAYTQYVTNLPYLCNSVMLFERLHTLGSKADRVMLYPYTMHMDEDSTSKEAELLRKARDEYNVKLRPIHVQHRDGERSTWADSYTKLLTFNQTDYRRVLNLDSDSTVLQSMDELFTIPSAPLAAPRAYWLYPEKRPFLSSQLILVEPSVFEFERIRAAIEHAGSNDFDMEIVNNLYGTSCMVLPHRRYDLLTAEMRAEDHTRYLGNAEEKWNADAALAEGKFLHFSDWPVPKPWIAAGDDQLEKHQPICPGSEEQGCRERELWRGFYTDFARRRQEVCGISV